MGILVDGVNEERKRRQQQKRIDWEKKLMADATAAEERKKQGTSFSAPVPKTAEEKETDINRREANRSVQYSMLPEVRAGAIKRAEASGDTDKVRELSRAKDIEAWAESDYVKKEAQRRYDEEFLKAKARGDENPAIAAMKAGDAYLNIYRNAAQETRNNVYNYRQAEKRNEMEAVSANADFDEKANIGAKITSSAEFEDGKYNLPSPFSKQVHIDIIMSFVNGTADSEGQYGEDKARVEQMTEKEKNVMRSFAADGQFDKAEEYYKLLERTLNKRVQEAENKETYKDAYERPVVGAVKNVGASFTTPAAYVENAVNAVGNIFRDEYVPTDTNSSAFRGAHTAKQTSEGVTDRAYDAAGGGTKGEVASFLAGTGLSMANFLSKAPLGPYAMLAMGADTAGQTTLDVLERGGTAGQALVLSTAAGTIEALTEKMPLDNLFKTAKQVGKTGVKATIKSVLKQAGMEATEEMVSELANTALDIAVMRDKSEYQNYISELEKNGTSRIEAEKEAFFQFFGKNILMAGAGGALSGGIMGGGASAISEINTAINRNRAGGGFTKTEFSDKITNKQIRALDAIGRALGINISIGAPTGSAPGAHNGYYENGNIVIAQDAENPLEVVLCHEVTHHMKRTAPAEYNAFLELAVNASEKLSNAEKSELITRYKAEYSKGTQTEFSDAQALDEIAADFASRIVNDISLFDRLAQSNRNVAVRFIDSIKDFIAKVKSTFSGDKSKMDTASQEKYGARVSELEAAVAQFEQMLSATETAVASGNINTAGTEAGGGRMYDLKMFDDGRRFVDVQTDQHLFDGLTENEKGRMATKIIKERFSGKVVGRDNRVFVNGRSAAEYGHPAKRISGLEYDAKMRASTELDNLIDAGTNFRTAPDGADGHVHPQATGDFKYFDTIFKVGNEYFEGRINILPNEKGDLLTDITQIKNITQDISSSYGQNPKSTFLRDNSEDINSSTNSIPDSPEKSNRQNSLKTEDLLSPDYGKTADTSSTASGFPSPQGEGSVDGSYIEETGLDTYFNDIEERAQVTAEKNGEEKESQVMGKPEEEKKPFLKKISETASFAKRKMLNSGEAIRKIAKTVKDEHLYGTYNRTRSAGNIVSDMLGNKQTNIKGQKVGESLEEIISPIKEKGEQHWNDFQRYIFLRHNVARMSLENRTAEERANAELQEYIKANSDLPTRTQEQLKEMSKREDNGGLRARKYLELQRKLRAAEEKNKPILFENTKLPLDANKSRWKAAQLLRENPEFKEYESKVRKYVDNLMQYRIDSGLITQEEADYFKKKYPDYVPTYRNTEENMKWITGKVNISAAISKAEGGQEKLLPLDVALSAMTNKVVKNGQKNILANKVLDLYDKNPELLKGYITEVNEEGRNLDAEFDNIAEESFLENTVGFYKDGKSVKMSVTPETFEAFDTLSNMPKEKIPGVKLWGNIVDTYKKLITTYDVTFGVRNFLKDFQDALIYSTDTKAFLKNFGRAYKEIVTNGEMWELYQAAGGLSSSRFEDIQNEGVTKSGKLKKIKEGIASLNVVIEQAPRLAEFMSVYEKGDPNSVDTLSDALLAAADITTNFGESGTYGKVINRYIVPFLNPSLQGTAKLVRTFTESKSSKAWIALAVKCTMFGLTAGFFNDLVLGAFGDDDEKEDYENLPERMKDNYFLFPTDDGKFIRLPKGRVMAALGVVADRLRDTMKGEKVDAGEALSIIAENILPENPLNHILQDAINTDLLNDESKGRTWYGTDIENDSLQSLPAGERFDNSTDYVSKALGKALGVSPKKLNYILKQYTGGVGRMVLPMLTPSEQKGDNVAENIALGAWSALTSSFMTDSKLSNKISGEFYDAVDAAEQAKNSAKGTLVDKIVYKHLNRERNMVGTYSSKIRAAETDKNLTSKERRAAVRAASAEKTAYQKTILENIDKYRSNVEKYLKKYPGRDEDKKLEYAYREANRALYGEEYAIRVNGGSDVHKKAEEKVKRGKTTWKEYYEEYFGKTDRRFEAISDRFDISYAEFEKIESAISKNSSKADEVAAIQKLGYKNSIARRIYTLYHDTK